jgi:hypothetical protein
MGFSNLIEQYFSNILQQYTLEIQSNMGFSNLKKNRGHNIDKLVQEAEKINSGSSETQKNKFVDERIWKPSVDKSGNGYAVIRFLPAPDGEELPWVRYWDHGFKGPTGLWYIERSLTSVGKTDPVLLVKPIRCRR